MFVLYGRLECMRRSCHWKRDASNWAALN